MCNTIPSVSFKTIWNVQHSYRREISDYDIAFLTKLFNHKFVGFHDNIFFANSKAASCNYTRQVIFARFVADALIVRSFFFLLSAKFVQMYINRQKLFYRLILFVNGLWWLRVLVYPNQTWSNHAKNGSYLPICPMARSVNAYGHVPFICIFLIYFIFCL